MTTTGATARNGTPNAATCSVVAPRKRHPTTPPNPSSTHPTTPAGVCSSRDDHDQSHQAAPAAHDGRTRPARWLTAWTEATTPANSSRTPHPQHQRDQHHIQGGEAQTRRTPGSAPKDRAPAEPAKAANATVESTRSRVPGGNSVDRAGAAVRGPARSVCAVVGPRLRGHRTTGIGSRLQRPAASQHPAPHHLGKTPSTSHPAEHRLHPKLRAPDPASESQTSSASSNTNHASEQKANRTGMGGYLCNQRRLGAYEPEGQVSMCAVPVCRTTSTSNSLWSRRAGGIIATNRSSSPNDPLRVRRQSAH